MPTLVGTDGYPLWDTFEVSLFLLTGVVIGIVGGFLFPSLWRTFRRRFPGIKRFSLSPSELETISLRPPWLVEPPSEPVALDSLSPTATAADIEQRMVFARALAQIGQLRESVQVLLEILKSPAASSLQIGRIYFELAQVYAELGLLDRALSLAKEYQLLRPKSAAALELRARIAKNARQPGELLSAAQIFRGNISSNAQVGLEVAHSLCLIIENLLTLNISASNPGFKNPPRETEDQLEAAERLAPSSLRLRHVRASVSLTKTLAQAQSRSDELWVAFYSEMSKRIDLAREFGLAYAPSLELLQRIAKEISSLGPLNEGEAYNARTLLLQEWQRPDLQKRFLKEFEILSLMLVISSSDSTNNSHYDSSLSSFWKLAFPTLWSDWELGRLANQSEKLKITCASALRVAITRHSCRSCKHIHANFAWTCLNCGSRESLVALSPIETHSGF